MEADDGDSRSKMEDYEVIEQTSRGALGEAFLVLHKTERKKYVMKKIPLVNQTEKSKRLVQQEIDLLTKLQNPYIVEYKDGWIYKDSSAWIVTSYCEGTDMAEIIGKYRGAFFPEEKICKWLTQLLLALDYLHSNRILHRDIKCSNIFLTKDNDIRLGDFGIAKLLNIEDPISSVTVTANYMCPELREDMPYGYKSEMWSLGCCLFEIAAHQPAFRAPDMEGLINKMNRALISPLPILYSATLKQIIKSTLRKSPEHRPTASDFLRHPHLQPYLLRCRNASSVFLPVKSPNNTKEKTMKKASPQKHSVRKFRIEKDVKALKVVEPVPSEGYADVQARSLAKKDNTSLITAENDYLVTKRVDPISYSANSSNYSEDSNSRDTSCDTTVCNGDEHDSSYSTQKESSDTHSTIISASNSQNEEQTELSPNCIGNFLNKSDMEMENLIDLETSCDELINWETEANGENSTSGNQDEMALFNVGCSDQDNSLGDGNASFPRKVSRLEGEAETTCNLGKMDNHSRTMDEAPVDERLSESNGIQNDEQGRKADDISTLEQKEKDEIKAVNQARRDISLFRTLRAVRNEDSKAEHENSSQYRADALEALLELCAQLLKQNKLDELSGVLKPFGEEAVSSRETAIWLTKSLMNAQKLAGDQKS